MQALPSLHNLSLYPPCAPTGVRVAPGAEPEKNDTCGICLESLADHIGGSQAPGEALRPAAPTWVRICANHHAYHKVCIRWWLAESPANRSCPECKYPVLHVDQLLRIPDGTGSKTWIGRSSALTSARISGPPPHTPFFRIEEQYASGLMLYCSAAAATSSPVPIVVSPSRWSVRLGSAVSVSTARTRSSRTRSASAA